MINRYLGSVDVSGFLTVSATTELPGLCNSWAACLKSPESNFCPSIANNRSPGDKLPVLQANEPRLTSAIIKSSLTVSPRSGCPPKGRATLTVNTPELGTTVPPTLYSVTSSTCNATSIYLTLSFSDFSICISLKLCDNFLTRVCSDRDVSV